jgi:hypothetical protein
LFVCYFFIFSVNIFYNIPKYKSVKKVVEQYNLVLKIAYSADFILYVCQTRQWCHNLCCSIGLRMGELRDQADYQKLREEFAKFKLTLAYVVNGGIFVF